MEINQINEYFRPGTLIPTVTQSTGNVVNVNSVVTMVNYRFHEGTQNITTGFAEIDFEVV